MSEFDKEDLDLITAIAIAISAGVSARGPAAPTAEVFDVAEEMVRERKRRYGHLLDSFSFE